MPSTDINSQNNISGILSSHLTQSVLEGKKSDNHPIVGSLTEVINSTSALTLKDLHKNNSISEEYDRLASLITDMPIENKIETITTHYYDKKITHDQAIYLLKNITQGKENTGSDHPFYLLYVKNNNDSRDIICLSPEGPAPDIRLPGLKNDKNMESNLLDGDFILARSAPHVNEIVVKGHKDSDPEATAMYNKILNNEVSEYINKNKNEYFKLIKEDTRNAEADLIKKYLTNTDVKGARRKFNDDFNKLYYSSKELDVNEALKDQDKTNKTIFEKENSEQKINELILNNGLFKYIHTQPKQVVKEKKIDNFNASKDLHITRKKTTAEVLKILNKNFDNNFIALIARVKDKTGDDVFVAKTLMPEHIKHSEFMLAPGSKAKEGHLVKVQLNSHPVTRGGKGEVNIISDTGIHRNSKFYAQQAQRLINNIPLTAPRFPDEENCLIDVNAAKRIDMTDKPFFTIDSSDTQSMDDAICVEPLPNGQYQLHVAIADVSSYVLPGSKIDTEAQKRGFTSYMPGSVSPMLPDSITYDLCSLKAGEKKAALVCSMTISNTGELEKDSVAFQHATIQSIAKCNYQNVSALLDAPASSESQDSVLHQQLKLTNSCIKKVHPLIAANNSYFSHDDDKIQMNNETGEFIDVKKSIRGSADKLVEGAMIIANIASATFLSKNSDSGVFRTHPGFENHQKINEILQKENVKLSKPLSTNEGYLELFEKMSNKSLSASAENTILNAHSRARYDWEANPHMGLGNNIYATFTSPIRKHSDLVNHRLISMAIDNLNKDEKKTAPKAESPGFIGQLKESNYPAKQTERLNLMKKSERNANLMIIYKKLEETASPQNPFPLYGTLRFSNHQRAQIYINEINTTRHIKPANNAKVFSKEEKNILEKCQKENMLIPLLVTGINNNSTPPALLMQLNTASLKTNKQAGL